jgi:hypothetical protein
MQSVGDLTDTSSDVEDDPRAFALGLTDHLKRLYR